MKQVLDLSKLPKAAAFPKSLNRRGTTPAFSLPGRISNRKYAIDPTHPSTILPLRAFPSYVCSAFSIRAVPKVAMVNDEWQPPPPVLKERRKRKDQLDISLLFKTFIKLTHKHTTLRRRVTRKLYMAISLVLTKGADADAPQRTLFDGNSGLYPISQSTSILNPKPTALVLRDWTYIITPKIEVYRMSYTDLIVDIRRSFGDIYSQAKRMEETWTYRLPFGHPEKLATQESASVKVNLGDNAPLKAVSLSVRPSSLERSLALEQDKHSMQSESWVIPRNVDHSLPLSSQPVQGSLYARNHYPRQIFPLPGLSGNGRELEEGSFNPVQQQLNSPSKFSSGSSSISQDRLPELSGGSWLGDDHAAPLRPNVPKLVFPSEAPTTTLRGAVKTALLGDISSQQGVTSIRLSNPAEAGGGVELLPGDKGMRFRGSLASHLDLPDRFAELSWKEFNEQDESRVGRRGPRTVSKSHGAPTPEGTVPASRKALTTPKPDGEMCEDVAVASSVMSRIFTTNPIFLDSRSLRRGKGKAK